MLWRALKDVSQGCYIDVGAQDPVADSVSKGFYDKGWRGVHIEPVPEYANSLRANRPDEQVFQATLGATAGVEKLFCISDSGLSTVVEDVAKHHAMNGAVVSRELSVPRMTLNDIFEALPSEQPVHWLKIDVEGAEKSVLLGWNKTKYRPWVVVVEATMPGSTVESYADWEEELTRHSYSHVYSDGLNRFYLANERCDALGSRFTYPPNVFDDASLSGFAHAPWTYVVASRGAETAHELHSLLEQAHTIRASELDALQVAIKEIQQQRESEAHAAQENTARLTAQCAGREQALQQQLQLAQIETLRWCESLAAREQSFSEALSDHFREFQSTLSSSAARVDALGYETSAAQRELVALTSQLAVLRSERDHERVQFAQRERELLDDAKRDSAQLSALSAEVARQSEAVARSQVRESGLLDDAARDALKQTELIEQFDARVAELVAARADVCRLDAALEMALEGERRLSESLDSALQQIARMTDEERRFQQQLAHGETRFAELSERTMALAASYDQQLAAANGRFIELEAQIKQAELLAQARSEAANRDKVVIDYLTNTARQYEARANALSGSLSWQVTAPLRRAMSIVQAMASFAARSLRGFQTLLLAIAKPLLLFAIGWIRRHPAQQRWLLRTLSVLPGLRGWALQYAAAIPFSQPVQPNLTVLTQASEVPVAMMAAISERQVGEAQQVACLPLVQAAVQPTVLEDEFEPHLRVWRLGHRVNA